MMKRKSRNSSTEQEFEEEKKNDELELALAIAGKRIARFDEEHWGQTFEYIKEHDEEFSNNIKSS